jgi:hypothetical protein
MLLTRGRERDADIGIADEREVTEPPEADAARDRLVARMGEHRLKSSACRPL